MLFVLSYHNGKSYEFNLANLNYCNLKRMA